MASKGYPTSYKKGFEMTIPSQVEERVFVAGAKKDGDKLLTNGGRVLGVTNVAPSLKEAIEKSYKDVEQIKFEGATYRKDIGARALKAGK